MMWNSEDISVGGWLGPVRVNRVHSTRFDTEAKSRGCQNSYLITHKQVQYILIPKHIFLHISII